jgi:hypothetical protein
MTTHLSKVGSPFLPRLLPIGCYFYVNLCYLRFGDMASCYLITYSFFHVARFQVQAPKGRPGKGEARVETLGCAPGARQTIPGKSIPSNMASVKLKYMAGDVGCLRPCLRKKRSLIRCSFSYNQYCLKLSKIGD